jgi:sulfur carrier protein ThiS adenylyltransferase
MLIRSHEGHACYQCLFPESEQQVEENCQTLGILGPILAIVAGMQALTAIKLLTGNPVNDSQLQLFDGLSQTWQSIGLQRQPNCQVCG